MQRAESAHYPDTVGSAPVKISLKADSSTLRDIEGFAVLCCSDAMARVRVGGAPKSKPLPPGPRRGGQPIEGCQWFVGARPAFAGADGCWGLRTSFRTRAGLKLWVVDWILAMS